MELWTLETGRSGTRDWVKQVFESDTHGAIPDFTKVSVELSELILEELKRHRDNPVRYIVFNKDEEQRMACALAPFFKKSSAAQLAQMFLAFMVKHLRSMWSGSFQVAPHVHEHYPASGAEYPAIRIN